MSETTMYTVGIIGTGKPWQSEGSTGFGMAHAHARGYIESGICRISALADLREDWAQAFGEQHADGKATIYTDYRQMLTDAKPDFVSICTWPHLHAPMVIAAAEAGVRAIHCEKPMASTMGEARRMAAICKANGVQLTFNHQRRFLQSFQKAKELLDNNAIGNLRWMEASCPNMHDWGTHWLNMFGYFNNEQPAQWVMGQIDVQQPVSIFGLVHETEAVSLIGYGNGVTGLMITGDDSEKRVGCSIRLIGSDGMLELHNGAPFVRLRGKGDGELHAVEGVTEGLHGDQAVTRAVVDAVLSLWDGRKPLLDVSNALAASEIIFATYESARRRGRIELPLTIDDNPLATMISEGIFPKATAT